MAKDYYDLLGVSRTATNDEIKRAFRVKAHQYHPDKSNGDTEKFKEINEAYQVLSDTAKRQQYDRFGQTYDQARRQGGGPAGAAGSPFGAGANPFGGGFSSNVDFGDLGDIFGDMFGFAGSPSRAIRGAPVQPDIARTTGQPRLAEVEAHSQQSQRPSREALSNQLEGLQREPKERVLRRSLSLTTIQSGVRQRGRTGFLSASGGDI